ncbi:MAG: hypothetical protein J6I85_03350 [Clostridia bacterium]|nr:hypothetical protein [Clostridia bacterium]MBQ6629186.1 hypothetical protein [Methanobrevibacter sp.]MBR0351422.1 hypothetical protein [Clostridia bacterium]
MKDKKNMNELALWIIILIVVVAMAMIGTMFLNSMKKENTSAESSNVVDKDMQKYLGNQTVDEIEKKIDEELKDMDNKEGVD